MSDDKKVDSPFDVAGAIENAFLMGIGVLEMTREKSAEIVDDLIERGKMSKSEAKKVADRIGDLADEQQESMRSAVARETDRAIRSAGMATKADVDDLRTQIAELKALILESSIASASSQRVDPLDEPSVE